MTVYLYNLSECKTVFSRDICLTDIYVLGTYVTLTIDTQTYYAYKGVDGYVAGLYITVDTIDVNNNTGDMTITSGYALNLTSSNDLVVTSNGGDIVLNPDGNAYVGSASAGNEIATNSYVDNAVSGLTWKQAVNVRSTVNNVTLTGSTPLKPLIML